MISTICGSAMPPVYVPSASPPSRRIFFTRFGFMAFSSLRLLRPLRVILDAERLHLRELLAPRSLLLVAPAPLGDLLPLGGGAVERVLRRLPLRERLGDLERQLALVLVGRRDHGIRHE